MSEKVVRGVFDSPEEEYARKNGLRFVHDKILVARTRSETPGGYEGRIYYLCFKDSGQPYIRKEIFTPGISAGSCMGGEFNEDLPMDFLVDFYDYSGWSVIGDIYGDVWQIDHALSVSNDNPAIQYIYLDYNEGEQFKFRRNGGWSENYGLGDPGTVFTAASQAEYGLVESGGNIQLESSGTWLVAIDLENLLFSAQLIPEGGQTIEVRLNQEILASFAAGSTPISLADGVLTLTNSSSYTGTVTEMRIYKSQTLTLSVPQGYAITDVEMTCTSSNPASGFGSGAPEGFADGVWSGNAQSLTFTAVDKQVRITAMTIKIAVL